MGQTVIVRRPYTNELDSTLILLEYQRDELNIENYDESHVFDQVKTHMTRSTHWWLNAYEGTRPVGCIGGYVVQSNFTAERSALINYFYVLKSHRDQGIYLELLRHFKEWSRSVDAEKIVAGDIDVNQDMLLEGLGFQRKNIWIKE
jgi:GNAT superfamily N-acetyltransferase